MYDCLFSLRMHCREREPRWGYGVRTYVRKNVCLSENASTYVCTNVSPAYAACTLGRENPGEGVRMYVSSAYADALSIRCCTYVHSYVYIRERERRGGGGTFVRLQRTHELSIRTVCRNSYYGEIPSGWGCVRVGLIIFRKGGDYTSSNVPSK
jgi:hypothetical protein